MRAHVFEVISSSSILDWRHGREKSGTKKYTSKTCARMRQKIEEAVTPGLDVQEGGNQKVLPVPAVAGTQIAAERE